MKTLVMLIAVIGSWSSSSFASWDWVDTRPDLEGRKVVLGETYLMNGRDADYIPVRNNKVCGITAFKIGVRGDDARIDDLKVVYSNGNVHDISVREIIRSGTDSRWVDLRGEGRCVQGVYVLGHSRTRTPRESRVVFFGMKQVNEDNDFGAVKLGQTAIGNGTDFDFIDLRGQNCGLRAFKIKVRNDAVRIEHLTLQFNNGQTQQINVNRHFRNGDASFWKDLDGNRRCIDKVFIVGHSTLNPRQGIVEFWGKF